MKSILHCLFGSVGGVDAHCSRSRRLPRSADWQPAGLKANWFQLAIGFVAFSCGLLGNTEQSAAQTQTVHSPVPYSVGSGVSPVTYPPSITVGKDSILQSIERGKSLLVERELPDGLEAAERVIQDWKALKNYLNQNADEANREAWLEYINLEPLVNFLEANRDAEQLRNRDKLRDKVKEAIKLAYWRMASNQEGLERQPLVELRESLQNLVIAFELSFAEEDDVIQQLTKSLDQLAAQISDSNAPLSPERTAKINELLEKLDESGMAPEVVQQVTAYISRPNVYLSFGQKSVQQIVSRPVSESGPNSDCILGTRVLSQTNLNGQLISQLVPNSNAAQIQLVINGHFNSRGTGYNSGVKIFNRSFGPVRSVRDLFITENGLSIGDVRSTADLNTQILGIQHPWKLVRRIAAKRAAQQKSAANAIAESKLENRLSNQFAQQTSQQLSSGNLIPKSAAADVLTRLDLHQPDKHWSTSQEYVLLQLKVRNDRQITTLTTPPPIVPGFDVVVQFHETAILNQADLLLSDRTLSTDQVREFVINLLPQDVDAGVLPLAELLSSDPETTQSVEAGAEAIDEVSEEILGTELGLEEAAKDKLANLIIRFDEKSPLIFEAREGLVRVGLNVKSIRRDDETLKDPSAISATYQPVRNSDGSVSLKRTGEINVFVKTAKKDRLNLVQKVIIAKLTGPLGNVFPETLIRGPLGDSIPAVKRFSPDPLTAKAIKPAEGWMTIYAE